jgi:hypothetical protein
MNGDAEQDTAVTSTSPKPDTFGFVADRSDDEESLDGATISRRDTQTKPVTDLGTIKPMDLLKMRYQN